MNSSGAATRSPQYELAVCGTRNMDAYGQKNNYGSQAQASRYLWPCGLIPRRIRPMRMALPRAWPKPTDYTPYRVDEDQQHHSDKLDDWVMAGIRRSRIVVADFTCAKFTRADRATPEGLTKGHVYYEAGFACWSSIPAARIAKTICASTPVRLTIFSGRIPPLWPAGSRSVWEDQFGHGHRYSIPPMSDGADGAAVSLLDQDALSKAAVTTNAHDCTGQGSPKSTPRGHPGTGSAEKRAQHAIQSRLIAIPEFAVLLSEGYRRARIGVAQPGGQAWKSQYRPRR